MSNIKIPSDNPTFNENTPHIHTIFDTSKLQPDNDSLYFSKIHELDVNFDALKSIATREISSLANKLDSLSLEHQKL